jgi:DNA-binding NarL/FixJ family response regulator
VSTVRILIADDHDVVRRGLRSILEGQAEWVVIDEATNGLEAMKKAEQWKPDVVVLDISMPELNGLEAARQILKVRPKTEVLILTVHELEQVVREVLEAGARGVCAEIGCWSGSHLCGPGAQSARVVLYLESGRNGHGGISPAEYAHP